MKKFLIAGLIFLAFGLGYGAISIAYPSFPPGVYNRMERYGFFLNRYDPGGDRVWKGVQAWGDEALPPYIDTADEFIGYVLAKLNGTYQTNQDRVGASFIIQTMIGNQGSEFNHPPSAAEIAEWEARVRYAESMGRIHWREDYSYVLNSYYQGCCAGSNWNDDGFYDGPGTAPAIVFGDGAGGGFGNIIYAIKWKCANPVGSLSAIPDDLNFDMSGTSSVNDTTVLPGQQITFTHRLTNNGPTGTAPFTIGWTTHGGPSPGGPWTDQASGNPGSFASGQSMDVSTQNVTVPANAVPNSQICRYISWAPDNQAGGAGSSTPVCAVVQYNYNLTPAINATVTSGGVPITGNVAEPGDTITFRYSVSNPAGNTESQSVACTYRQQTWPGYNQTAPTIPFVPAGSYCPPNRVFPGNSNTTTATEIVSAATANTTICRTFTITPASQSGGSRTTSPSCVQVATKPYARVWGGDISAGNGLANSSGVCTNNNNGAIVGWNKRPVGSSAGAGVQFAAFALARITDFASALYDPGGAPSPNGLSFANTSGNATNGDFGGSFGSVPCIRDYYATLPATTAAIPATVAAMVSGVYGGNGNITLGGGSIVNPNNRITVYVDGNLYITTNITYAGAWDADSVPLFEVIVRGNIYIDNDVTQLDGVYVAQPNSSGVGGQIHTCATGFAALPLNTLYSTCARKLTVNGLFTANQVRLLRTIGTLAQSNTSEASTSGNVAETFNYGPAAWMAQPVRQNQGGTPDYDAIISLPPVL